MTRAGDIDDVAARWLLRREEPDWSSEDAGALEAWLDSAPEHRVAFWRLECGWAQVDRAAALGQAAPPRNKRRRRMDWRLLAAAAVVLAFVAVGFAVMRFDDGKAQTYATGLGDREIVSLPDGSRIELNTITRLRTAIGRDHREVWLYGGEAYFEVAHDPRRPFVVHAGDHTVTVLGTKFSVRRNGDRVQVTVVEGRVRVAATKTAAAVAPAILKRDDVAIAEGASILVAPVSAKRVDDRLSWRRGMLIFDQDTLQEAAAEFNRYNRKQLVVAGADVAKIRIGGAFEAENVDGFARLLREAYGLRVDDEGAVIKISN